MDNTSYLILGAVVVVGVLKVAFWALVAVGVMDILNGDK